MKTLDSFRKEVIGDCTLYLGDCREILPLLPRVDAVVTDPPYGIGVDTDSTRFSGGVRTACKRRIGTNYGSAIVGDDKPFNASFLYDLADEVVIWGWNNFAESLPRGTSLVWIKTGDAGFGSFLSDAELAWEKGGHGVYCFRDLTNKAESRHRVHPTQKPLPLMQWCVSRVSDHGETILDPFMGSGTTGVACVKLGRKFIGIEIDEGYFDIACRRIQEAYKQPDMFIEASKPQPPEQLSLIAAE